MLSCGSMMSFSKLPPRECKCASLSCLWVNIRMAELNRPRAALFRFLATLQPCSTIGAPAYAMRSAICGLLRDKGMALVEYDVISG